MVSNLTDMSHDYWSGRAQEYSALHMKSFNSEKHDRFAHIVAPYIPQLGRAPKALDLGCGSGFMSLLLLEAGCDVVGIDFSEDMLEQARANVASRGYSAEYLCMKAQSLDFPDDSFDFAISRNVTWVLEDVDRVYAEVLRVLRPGATFLNLDAHYGKAFREQDERGETPQHPTQTIEQLRTRNALTSKLAITSTDRPLWDLATLWNLNASRVTCERIDGIMFAISAQKAPAQDA